MTNQDLNTLTQNFTTQSLSTGRGQKKISPKQQEKQFGPTRHFSEELIHDISTLIIAMQNGISFFTIGTQSSEGAKQRLSAIMDRMFAQGGLNDEDLKFLRNGYYKTKKNSSQCQNYLRHRSTTLKTLQVVQLDELLSEEHISENLFLTDQEVLTRELLQMGGTKITSLTTVDPRTISLQDFINYGTQQEKKVQEQEQRIADLEHLVVVLAEQFEERLST